MNDAFTALPQCPLRVYFFFFGFLLCPCSFTGLLSDCVHLFCVLSFKLHCLYILHFLCSFVSSYHVDFLHFRALCTVPSLFLISKLSTGFIRTNSHVLSSRLVQKWLALPLHMDVTGSSSGLPKSTS